MIEAPTNPVYSRAPGGLPPQTQMQSSSAVFTDAYAVIPRSVQTDIVTSLFPGWDKTRGWILARPLSGFAETFAQYIMRVEPSGGSTTPEPDPLAQAALFIIDGQFTLTLDGTEHTLATGSFAFVPAGSDWAIRCDAAPEGQTEGEFHWIRKRYQPVEGLAEPQPIITSDQQVAPTVMPDCGEKWSTTRFIDPSDLRYDFHVNIVNFEPGGVIPFMETHVMEHGLFVLEGHAVYHLNKDWVEVSAGDFMWLRAFCPQACYAAGPGRFRYLLYKDVNRHPSLSLG